NASSDTGSGLAKYQLYIDNALNKDNLSTTSVTPSASLTCGAHTWYATAIDNAGNATNAGAFTVNIICSGGFSSASPSVPAPSEPADAGIFPDSQANPESINQSASDCVNNNLKNLFNLPSQTVETISACEAKAAYGYNQTIVLDKTEAPIYQKLEKDNQALIDLGQNHKNAIMNFIHIGTPTTLHLGAGERAGVINSFQSAYGHLPQSEADWQDIIKIANGRWPAQTNIQTEANAQGAFKKIYLKEPNQKNPYDNAALTVIAYGLRPVNRNLNSEAQAIKYFKAIYGYNPQSATAWDIVRAIAYSGARR
ncbi:hypothetical protein COX67_05065, partial [Candidatus Falkowbacteria bacterium CG_4_10_14_0_2_um_filter_36_22]